MKTDKFNDHPSEYLNDLEEWNEHQYDPGHWTGGHIPPQIKYGGRKLGIGLLALGLLTIPGIVINFTSNYSFNPTDLIGVGGEVLLVIAGIRLIIKKDK